MSYLILLLSFLIVYHINFFVLKDIINYYKKKNITIDKKLYKELIFVIFLPILIPIFIKYIEFFFDYNIFLEIIFSFCMGIVFTKSNWFLCLNRMKEYKDTYFYVFSKKDFYNINKQLREFSIKVSINNNNKKYEILEFMNSFPYELYLNRSKEINACACLDENKIIITEGLLRLPIEEVKAAIGHEIIHLKINSKNKGKYSKIKFFLKLYSVYFLIAIVTGLSKRFSIMLFLIFLIILLIFCFIFLFYHLLIPERYLYQFEELKCDRLACSLNGVTKEGMLNLLIRLEKYQNRKKYIWYKEIIYRYFLFDAHPNIKYRIKKIEKYHKWSVLEYIKFPFYMFIRLLEGKGWN